MNWRHMDEAPRDGTLIEVFVPAKCGLPGFILDCSWHPEAGFCVDEIRDPTAWRPKQAARGTDRDDELVGVPRWVAGVLAAELECRTNCGPHKAYERNCKTCEAIRIGLAACDHGCEQRAVDVDAPLIWSLRKQRFAETVGEPCARFADAIEAADEIERLRGVIAEMKAYDMREMLRGRRPV